MHNGTYRCAHTVDGPKRSGKNSSLRNRCRLTNTRTSSPSDRMSSNYWIFVSADFSRNYLSKPSAYQVAVYRLKQRMWGINSRTRYKTWLRPGDFVVVYATGKREFGKCFVGSCKIGSPLMSTTGRIREAIDSPTGELIHQSPFYVTLTKTKLFPTPVSIRPLLKSLEFIVASASPIWGLMMQGGVVRISRQDFALIRQRSELKKVVVENQCQKSVRRIQREASRNRAGSKAK